MERLFLSKLILLWIVLKLCSARPAAKDDHVTMSGEPTHFQVDDKAAELEINANAMGVKVNAKPASLQVVSKPGAPSVPVAHPAVVVPQLPAPYLTAPYYPSPMVIGHRRTTRRHHFFMDSGNDNYKKTSVPTVKSHANKDSKKSEIPSKKKAKKRQWIQRLPIMSQLAPYPQITNVRVHPYVQQLAALAQGYARHSIQLPNQVAQASPPQMYTFVQRLPGMVPTLGPSVENGATRSEVSQGAFFPPALAYHPVFAPAPTPPLMPQFAPGLPYGSSGPIRSPVSGYNGYYDPILSRDFIPDIGALGMPRIPTPRAFVPGGIRGAMNYPGYTPLGVWQRVNKRLTIPKRPSTKNPGKISTNTQETKRTLRNYEEPPKTREKRSDDNPNVEKLSKTTRGKHSKSVAKRQYILTRPVFPQARELMYVPVVSSPSVQPLPMTALGGSRRNLVLNLPSKTSSAFVLKVPSTTQDSQMYRTVPTVPISEALYQPMINPNIFGNPGNNVLMGLQRSNVHGLPAEIPGAQSPIVPGVQFPGVETSGMQNPGNNRLTLSDLAGIQGQAMFQNDPHKTTLYTTDALPSQYQDQIFGGSPLQGRTAIPRGNHRRHRFGYSRDGDDEYDREYAYPDDSENLSSYEDGLNSGSSLDRVEDEGSYDERTTSDGRTVLRKDHVGFGPITVEAKTADVASRDRDSATDMDLDSDKRKMIPRPRLKSYLDKRLGIPKPDK